MTLIAVAGVVSARWLLAPAPAEQPASDLAAIVERLGKQVVEQERRVGVLPARLNGLPALPADALEMPLEHYSERLLSPQLEVFYSRLPAGGFVVIGRFADDAWMFAPALASPLRRVPPYSN